MNLKDHLFAMLTGLGLVLVATGPALAQVDVTPPAVGDVKIMFCNCSNFDEESTIQGSPEWSDTFNKRG